MCEVKPKNTILTEPQREYITQFGGDLLAVINSQLHLCGPNPEIGAHSIHELTIESTVLLRLLHLESHEPDHMSLLERLLFLDSSIEDAGKKAFGIFLTARRMEKFIDKAIIAPYRIGTFTPSEEQEVVLRNIATIFDRQIVREGNACTVAQAFALKFLEYRPEYLSAETITRLTVTQVLPAVNDTAGFFKHNFTFEDIIQLYGLELRAGTPLEEMRYSEDEDAKGALRATAQFWRGIATSYFDLMNLKVGVATVTCHPSDLIEFTEDAIAAQALSLKELHAELGQ